jgi:nucleotide-binding universal stress UspA family protein
VAEEIEVELHIGRGAVYDEIIQYANEVKADLIIISAVRPQLRDYMLGPNASKIVRHSGVSVLVVRE